MSIIVSGPPKITWNSEPKATTSQPFTGTAPYPRSGSDELFLIHQPGWNTALSLLFLKTFGAGITWYHFGDLDPEGLAIYQHLQCEREKPFLFIPTFWNEYEKMFSHQLCDPWPETITTSHSEPLLKRLFSDNTWLEQEPIILDERFEEEVRQLFGLEC